MINWILFDGKDRDNLLPFTFTRPVSEIRIGILTIKEKWSKYMDGTQSYLTQPYLQKKFPLCLSDENVFINGSVLPNKDLVNQILDMPLNSKLVEGEILIAVKIEIEKYRDSIPLWKMDVVKINNDVSFSYISNVWDIFQKNGEAIEADYNLLTAGKKSQKISSTNQLIGDRIFLEQGATVECSILNASAGPIYIGKNAEVMEGSIIRGGLALCEGATLKLGSKIYGPTTIGPFSKVGGEVNNSVIFGYSNKGHDGFLGNSVLGEWCNLGADTNTSNLKNNYGNVRLWSYPDDDFVSTSLQFCGLIMADHSKSGINTMFNTATSVGVCANVFGGGFPDKYIPSFSWGGADGFETFKLEKAFEVAERVMERRGVQLSVEDKSILTNVFERALLHRK